MGVTSPFNPQSPFAQSIADLFTWNLAIAGVIFVLVTSLVIYIAIRYRARPGQPEPAQVFGHRTLEIVWTLAPALILVGVAVSMVSTMRAADPPAGDQQPDLVVTGLQWWWRVEYSKSGVVTANEIHVPVGRPLLVRIQTADVVHDFWVPQLGPKRDITPDQPNHIWLRADTPGTYLGYCSEYCGNEHAWMLIRVIAQPQAEFDAWQRAEAQPAAAPAGGDAARGALIFQQHTCVSCHAIAGTSGAARVGPDLTHLAARQTLGAGRIANTPDNLARWIANPHELKPGVLMPGFQLPPDDLRALVAYLETLK
jgi:cytochrome c oxidase subunit 2